MTSPHIHGQLHTFSASAEVGSTRSDTGQIAKHDLLSRLLSVDTAQRIQESSSLLRMLCGDAGYLFCSEAIDCTTLRASKLDKRQIKPCDRHFKGMAALAAHGNTDCTLVGHRFAPGAVVSRNRIVANFVKAATGHAMRQAI